MAANGLMYTASFNNVSITNAAQNIWEFMGGISMSKPPLMRLTLGEAYGR